MLYIKLTSAFLAVVIFASGQVLACEDGRWIQSVSSDGRIIILEDWSVWEVNPVDQIDSMLWIPVSNIVACDDKLINTDDGEIVDAVRIR